MQVVCAFVARAIYPQHGRASWALSSKTNVISYSMESILWIFTSTSHRNWFGFALIRSFSEWNANRRPIRGCAFAVKPDSWMRTQTAELCGSHRERVFAKIFRVVFVFNTLYFWIWTRIKFLNFIGNKNMCACVLIPFYMCLLLLEPLPLKQYTMLCVRGNCEWECCRAVESTIHYAHSNAL